MRRKLHVSLILVKQSLQSCVFLCLSGVSCGRYDSTRGAGVISCNFNVWSQLLILDVRTFDLLVPLLLQIFFSVGLSTSICGLRTRSIQLRRSCYEALAAWVRVGRSNEGILNGIFIEVYQQTTKIRVDYAFHEASKFLDLFAKESVQEVTFADIIEPSWFSGQSCWLVNLLCWSLRRVGALWPGEAGEAGEAEVLAKEHCVLGG